MKKALLISLLLFIVPLVAAIALNIQVVTVDNFLNGSHDIAVGDMDGDGDLDIVADAYLNDSVYWYEQISETVWTRHVVDTNLTNAHDIQVGDIDGDGVLDIIGGALSGSHDDYNLGNGSLFWYNGSGDTWTRNLIKTSNRTFNWNNAGLTGLRGISIYDIDKDGVDDIITAVDGNTYGNKGGLYWFKNPNGTNASNTSLWTQYTLSAVISNLAYAESGDLDKDGNPDIVSNGHHPENNGKTIIFFGAYNLTNVTAWVNNTILSENTSWHSDIVDFDNDSYLDVLVSHWKHDKYSWYKNPAENNYWLRAGYNIYSYGKSNNTEPLNQSFSEITIEIWFTPLNTNFSEQNRYSNYGRLLDKESYQVATNNDSKNILFQWKNNTGNIGFIVSDTQEWEAGKWYQFLLNINSSKDVVMYINGIEQSNTGKLGGTIFNSADSLTIGNRDIGARSFNGSIGKIKIWNLSLTDSEKEQTLLTGRSQDSILTNNLIYYLSMSGGSDRNIADLSGLNQNLTFYGVLERNNSIRNMSAWVETVIDTNQVWTNGSMSIEAYDIDGDGDLDLVVNTIPEISINTQGYYMWYERLNSAGTSFTRRLVDSNISRTSWAHDLVVNDIDNDGYGDLVGASASANKVMLYLLSAPPSNCTQTESVWYPIILLFSTIGLLTFLFIFIKGKNETFMEGLTLERLIVGFIILAVGLALVTVIGDLIAGRCPI